MLFSYPAHREADVVLRDGSTVHIRPIRHEDGALMETFFTGLSLQSLAFRFFTGAVDAKKVAKWSVDVDYEDRFGLIATAGADGSVAGHVSYTRTEPDRAEVGIEVADAHHGHGLGTLLLEHLAEAASEHGITVFEGHVLAHNQRMIDMFRESGFPVTTRAEPGEILFEFPTLLTTEGLERYEKREQIAAAAAVRRFLSPRSIAVIGAGRDPRTISGATFHNLIASGFAGPVYPVNPKADVVQSVVAYPSVTDIPGPVDLAVIAVPADAVADVARECAAKGVAALVVISAGFAETDDAGRARQRELLAICRDTGMRLIGPNCMGILNTAPDVRMNATFAPIAPTHGRVGFLSQSGALGLAVIDHAASLGLGLSSFVSIGNKTDISGNDLIQYWEADDDTDLILLYLESFGNPRKFARIARRVGRDKPIIAVKSGRSTAGARATSSHTGAMIAASDIAVDALFEQSGVIRTETLAEMFDVASLLANQPIPSGNRVAIVTNAGGPGILCADACEAAGLEIPQLPEEVRRTLGFLPAEAGLTNPVDMIASASGEDYRRTIEALAAWDGIDALIVIFIPPLVTSAADVAEAIRSAVEALPRTIPMLSVFMSSRGVPDELASADVRIPSYAFPEDAARALARAVRYGVWRAQPAGRTRSYEDARATEASSIIAEALANGGGWLAPDKVWRLLSCYDLPLVEQRLVDSAREAGSAARDMGGPVALKAVSSSVLHKTEAGGIALDLRTPSKVVAAANQMRRRFGEAGGVPDGYVVQPMAAPGVETLVGVVADPLFGPVIACGAGGTTVELLRDFSVRVAPITEEDARAMIRSLRTFPLLDGYRGAPRADVPALEDVLLRVNALVEAHPEIAEMDLNPVIVGEAGATIVDARVRLEHRAPRRPLGARRTA